MGRGHDVLELEQRRVGARLLGEDVETGGGDPAGLEGVVERLLVHDPAAGGVDQDQRGPRERELVGTDQADGLRRLGQVDADEVGLGHQLLEADHPHAHLGGAAGLDVGVVGDHVHAERGQPLRDEYADAPEADDAERLLVELDAGVPAALPLPPRQGRMGRTDVARGGQHQCDGELGGTDDVGGRRVDDEYAVLGGRLDVDVVQADTGPGDDLEALRCGQGFPVDLRGGADQDGVDVDDGAEQLGAIGPVALADLEVGAEGLDGRGAQLLGDEYDGPGIGGGHDVPDVGDGLPARRCAFASVTDITLLARGTTRPWAPASQKRESPGIGEGPSKYELLGPSFDRRR